ncbi:MAG: hypothetical protein K6F87_08685, partial [Lachnospiraceae bacterium]|nr:hypothetical protein [Lachnospiraceae bacterium]
MSELTDKKRKLMFILNFISLIILGLVLQIGGAYIVNAAVEILGEGTSGATQAASDYKNFMDAIRQIEPRQFVHIIFVAPLVEEIV